MIFIGSRGHSPYTFCLFVGSWLLDFISQKPGRSLVGNSIILLSLHWSYWSTFSNLLASFQKLLSTIFSDVSTIYCINNIWNRQSMNYCNFLLKINKHTTNILYMVPSIHQHRILVQDPRHPEHLGSFTPEHLGSAEPLASANKWFKWCQTDTAKVQLVTLELSLSTNINELIVHWYRCTFWCTFDVPVSSLQPGKTI